LLAPERIVKHIISSFEQTTQIIFLDDFVTHPELRKRDKKKVKLAVGLEFFGMLAFQLMEGF
jgi:hypothetical protein